MTRRRTTLIALFALLALFGAACSSDDSSDSATSDTTSAATEDPESTTSTTAAVEETLRIMVTNDDGVGADGINAMVDALVELDDVEVTVVAPAENASGSGNRTTDGELVATDATTMSGYPATAIEGLPADTVNWALDGGLDEVPHVIVSGTNEGQNPGPVAFVSGTVGAARTAAGRGVPSVAASTGHLDDADWDFTSAIEATVAWIAENRADLTAATPVVDSGEIEFPNINGPTCGETGETKDVIEAPLAGEGAEFDTDCSRDVAEPADEIEAFNAGWTTIWFYLPSEIEDTPEPE